MAAEDGMAVMEPATKDQAETEGLTKEPRYHLPVFEGPLDLLLYLIQKSEIEITDIPIAQITEQYSAHLEQMRELDLDVAADFILMAATLIHIKSRMILPRPQEEEGAGPIEDPRQPLVEQLLEYKRFKEIARLLEEKLALSSAQFSRQAEALAAELDPDRSSLDVDLYDLLEALQRVVKRAADRKERLVYAPEVSLTARINAVLELLEGHGSLLFTELFEEGSTRLHVVVTFLALLELVKQRVVRLFQEVPLGPFRVVLVT
jgi:segregation and condensation protein A